MTKGQKFLKRNEQITEVKTTSNLKFRALFLHLITDYKKGGHCPPYRRYKKQV